MKFPNSLIQPMTVSQPPLRASVWLAALVAMLFAGTAWGQMKNTLVLSNLVPASSSQVYTDADIASDTAKVPLVSGTGPVANDGDLTLDSALADIDGGGVGVVDWVLVQLRIVPDSAVGLPLIGPFVEGTVIATKAALLLTDGSISDPDAEDLTIGEIRFDVDFNSENQNLYVAISHRNHVPVMGMETVQLSGDGETYEYAFDSFAKFVGGPRAAKQKSGSLGAYLGNVNTTAGVQAGDAIDVQTASGLPGYVRQNVLFTTSVGGGQAASVSDNTGISPQVTF